MIIIRIVTLAMLMLTLAGAATSAPQSGYAPQRGQRGGQRDTRELFQKAPGGRSLSEREKQDRLDFLGKFLAKNINAADAGADVLFLNTRASELYERAKEAGANNFQFESLTGAVLNLLRASEKVSMAPKADRIDEDDKRDAALQLQKCYFRVQQADYFAGLSGEKDAKQYLTQARSLYQQARSAYDTRQYDRAQLLGDAASNIVTALENLAHACLRIPDPPVIK